MPLPMDWINLADDEVLVRAALNLALGLKHKVPDCLYLALAEREGALLVSADRKLLALARGRGVEVIAIPSACGARPRGRALDPDRSAGG